jgi:3-hydroxyacyl-[acyl-carrier protein] dehydratase/trans-2-decenoyl-[acyl-carrier protein] isomerase
MEKDKFSKKELLDVAAGKVFGLKNGKLPAPPMLMFDRILKISKKGGKFGKGEIRAELDINPAQWFFQCHFKGDPVMPGCLGLDGFWQLVGFFLSWVGGEGRGRALGVKDLKFKGQVRPYHRLVQYKIDIKRVITKPVYMAWADAELKVKNKIIYIAENLHVGLFNNLTYDFGADPALDSF